MVSIPALDAFAPAGAMLAALRERRVSSTELVDLHLDRIARHNQALNAIVVHAADPRGEATQADVARAGGDDRALLGLPISLKESINVRGMPCSAGVPEMADYRSSEDGAIAARVLGAGAVLLGKTNVPPMLSDWQSDNPIYGRTVNPWDAALTPACQSGCRPSDRTSRTVRPFASRHSRRASWAVTSAHLATPRFRAHPR